MEKKLSDQPRIGKDSIIHDVTFGYANEVGDRVKMVNVAFGDYSYLCDDSDIINATVGKFCSIAAHTRINPGNHPLHKAALHHFTYRSCQYGFSDEDDEAFFQWRKDQPVHIGHDVWIGHGAVITAGVSIGNGAAIGANAVVTKDVQPYQVVAGVPAKPIRYRFDEPTRTALDELGWWHWSGEQLTKALADFRELTAEQFVAKHY